MNDNKLTENQTAVMKGILEDKFSEGPEFGAWYDDIVNTAFEQGLVKTKQQVKATLNQLIKKGLLDADTTIEEGSSWLTLTLAGGDALGSLVEEEAAEEEAPEPAVEEAEEDLLGDAPEDEDEDLLGDVEDEGTSLLEGVATLLEQEAEGDVDTITVDHVATHTENYTVNEWKDADGTEWTETLFADGSRTIKRRRLVSESWRTDYWGAEFSGDKEKATTAKLAKAARASGHFTHVLHEAPAA